MNALATLPEPRCKQCTRTFVRDLPDRSADAVPVLGGAHHDRLAAYRADEERRSQFGVPLASQTGESPKLLACSLRHPLLGSEGAEPLCTCYLGVTFGNGEESRATLSS